MNTQNNNGTTAAKVNERVQQYGEPERRPTFAEIVRDEVESHYNNGDSNDETAQTIAKVISRAVADIYGKGNAARYILDAISCHVQGHCNPALNDEE